MSRILVEAAHEFGRRMALESGQGLIGDHQVMPPADDHIREGGEHHKALPIDALRREYGG